MEISWDLLNQQINKEFYSAYLYLDFSNYFKGLPDFKQLRIAMLRAETVEELFEIFEQIKKQYGTL